MGSICIFTDSSVQFSQPAFEGRGLVHIINLSTTLTSSRTEDSPVLRSIDLPASLGQNLVPRLNTPSVEDFKALFLEAADNYSQILGVFLSNQLSDCFANAQAAAEALRGRCPIQIVDSQTIAIGLGMIVQSAAEKIQKGSSLVDVDRHIRSLIPRIYTVICTPNLTYLWRAGIIDRAQAAIGEMTSILPIFAIEEGRLTPLEKVRNHRQVLDFYIEYLDEFENLLHIAHLQNVVGPHQEGRLIKEHCSEVFPGSPFTEHPLNLPTATLFGPTACGMVVVDVEER